MFAQASCTKVMQKFLELKQNLWKSLCSLGFNESKSKFDRLLCIFLLFWLLWIDKWLVLTSNLKWRQAVVFKSWIRLLFHETILWNFFHYTLYTLHMAAAWLQYVFEIAFNLCFAIRKCNSQCTITINTNNWNIKIFI